ncbi:MAG: DUF2141 domain-containing protein [Cyanomargarita calcarea GSE-NOS-MK-12-04C]|jgi:uncharacterized protein (DUF2141 family)|uniref:DUF2141 domain-containing protein n=1 Tax=Cyanomargarita calcarea GSE-NOS-MK-12-04C TaxID=2839659 RepID=A0A951QRB9_9CYAN|nr:DUF2141 domain-containing protein [Cyanomargarita calcarea GSE-NOS-MK-12-04C]
MVKASKFSPFLLLTLASISLARIVNAESTARLTIVVNGISHQKGQICFRIFSNERGFPLSDTSEVQSGCTQVKGNSVTKQFSGLKLGTYAVAVLDDQNGDYKLDRDFFGIPQEGFGISNNPIVSAKTGVPKFKNASFLLKEDTTISILMKYSLAQ